MIVHSLIHCLYTKQFKICLTLIFVHDVMTQSTLSTCRNMAQAGVDEQDSRPVAKPQKHQQQQYQDQPDEEPSDYRGYTNPKVQSRSFKMLQESLNYTEAGEEGIILPSGQTPGEGVVLRAYNEGKMRMQELAEINPRNFASESPLYERGQNLLKSSEEDEAIIAKLKCAWKSKEPTVVSAKSYTPGKSAAGEYRSSQPIDLSVSSVLAPTTGQQTYLQQAHAHHGNQPAPPLQITINQPGQVTTHKPVQAQTQSVPRRRERKRQPKEQQAQNIQSSVSVVQSSGFIPTTDTVSSVAVELNLKHASTVEHSDASVKEGPRSDSQLNEVQPAPNGSQNSQADVQATETKEKPLEEVAKESLLDDKPVIQHKETPQPQLEQATQDELTVKPTDEKAEPIVDSTDASVEPTNDLILGYGEHMAETVISESIQDATQGKRDIVDGSSESKVSEGVVNEEEKKTTEPKIVEENSDISVSNTKVAETEQQAGKLEMDSETAQSAQSDQNSVALEDARPETVVNVDSSQTEIVVESVTNTDNKESVDETCIDVSVEESSKETLFVDQTQDTTQKEPSSTSSETSDIKVSQNIDVEKSAEGTVVAVDVSEGIVIDENIKISSGEAEHTFFAEAAEESSFVFEVQEDSKTGSSDIQSETFEISVGDNTEESANFTFDLGTDVSINEVTPRVEEGTEVSISLESNKTVETVILQEPSENTEDPKKEEHKAEQNSAPKTNKTNIPPKKAKFVDSQGGVSARLARFNLKKK